MNAAVMLVCLAGGVTAGQPGQPNKTVFQAPSIQVRSVSEDNSDYLYLLYNRINIGRNYQKPKNQADYGNPDVDFSRTATLYFHDKSPIGMVLYEYNWFPGKENTYHADSRLPASMIGMGLDPMGQLVHLWSEPPIAVLGMDVGTLAAYARPGQTMHFTERVPVFVKLSLPGKDQKRYFHYVQDALDRGANLTVFEGEPRTMIEKNGGANFYQIIVVETYKLPVSGIHTELMTKEGLKMLMTKVRDDGIVCFHTSNRYYELAPIIASAARDLKYACLVGRDRGFDKYRYTSEWVMVARDKEHLAHLTAPGDYWSAPKRTDKKFIWTDKGGGTFRGLYYSDPAILRLSDMVRDIEVFLAERAGISYAQLRRGTDPIHRLIRACSALSTAVKNRDLPENSKNEPKK
jgi:hypothetical protein